MNSKDIMLRGGHKLVYESGDLWKFEQAESWMPIYLNYDKNNQIISLDSENMGMPLLVSANIKDYIIRSIIEVDGKFCVMMKKKYKNFISELESGDVIYVVTPDEYGGHINKCVFDSVIDDEIFDYGAFFGIKVYDDTKAKKNIIINRNRLNEDLTSKDGLKTGVVHNDKYEKLFTKPKLAQSYAYDLCQDIVEMIKRKQREIITKY